METVAYDDQMREGFWSRIRSFFNRDEVEEVEQEEYRYTRKLMDGRIEKYLDNNFDSYIDEYQILTALDLNAYDDRYSKLTGRISSMKSFLLDADVSITRMESDIETIKRSKRSKKSKE